MSNQTEQPNRRFLRQLVDYRRHDGFRDEYEIAGHRWWCFSHATQDCLNLHIEAAQSHLRMLEVEADGYGRFRWSYSLRLPEGVYVRAGGFADTPEGACSAAVAFAPETLTLDYLAETIWYSPSPDLWIAALDGEEATVCRHHGSDNYYWRRQYAGAAEVLAITGQQLSGHAASLKEAMRAAIDAPDRLIRACAALIAGIRNTKATPDSVLEG